MKTIMKAVFLAFMACVCPQIYGWCCDPNPSQGHCDYKTVQQICKTSRASGYVLKDGSGKVVTLKPGGLCPKCNHPGFIYTTDRQGRSVLYHSCDRDGLAQMPPVEIIDDTDPNKPCPY